MDWSVRRERETGRVSFMEMALLENLDGLGKLKMHPDLIETLIRSDISRSFSMKLQEVGNNVTEIDDKLASHKWSLDTCHFINVPIY